MNKLAKTFLWGLFAFVLLSEGCAAPDPKEKAAMSVRKLDEGLYYMEYKGDDVFSGLMEKGGCHSSEEITGYIMSFLYPDVQQTHAGSPAPTTFGCSALTVQTLEGDVLMGRNFDFDSATGLVLHTVPEKGYETYTTFNTNFFNFGDGWVPEGIQNQFMALGTLFLALDGINEKGLAIADLVAGDDAETHQESGKPALTTTTAICYMLKNAATVDEALDLLRGIDMQSDIGTAHHYAISDASGKSVVVEYVDNEMYVVESMAVANHYLCKPKLNVGLIEGDDRYEYLCEQINTTGGIMNKQQLTEAMAAVSQPEKDSTFLGTAWTMVMDLTNPSVTYYSRRHFDRPFKFEFER